MRRCFLCDIGYIVPATHCFTSKLHEIAYVGTTYKKINRFNLRYINIQIRGIIMRNALQICREVIHWSASPYNSKGLAVTQMCRTFAVYRLQSKRQIYDRKHTLSLTSASIYIYIYIYIYIALFRQNLSKSKNELVVLLHMRTTIGLEHFRQH